MLSEIDKPKYLKLPQIPNVEVNLLWDVFYYDSPLEGVAEWKGQRYWFDSIKEEIPKQNEFFLVRLPDEEMKKIEDIQRLRESFLGPTNRHDDGHSAERFVLKSDTAADQLQEYQQLIQQYDEANAQLPLPDLTKGEVIGWCYRTEAKTDALSNELHK